MHPNPRSQTCELVGSGGGEGCSLRRDYDNAAPAVGATSFDDCSGEGEWSFLATDDWITASSSAALAGTMAIQFRGVNPGDPEIRTPTAFRTMPGIGWCQDVNGHEATARYFLACPTQQQCEQLCSADAACVAFAFSPTGSSGEPMNPCLLVPLFLESVQMFCRNSASSVQSPVTIRSARGALQQRT